MGSIRTIAELERVGKALEREICEMYRIPLLDISAQERLRSILAFRNDRRLHRRKCDATGKSIISSYRPDCGYKIYASDIWWGDTWNGFEFGLKANSNHSFFDQFYELKKSVPREGTSVVRAENCDYNSHTRDSKNCYLSHLAIRAENLLYSYWTVGARDVIEGFYTTDCELCARCSYVTNCYDCVHLDESANCNECFYSFELKNCSHCLFCSNLNNKEYYVRNQPVSKEEFAKQKAIAERDYVKSCDFLSAMLRESPRRAQHTINSEFSVGGHIQNSKNIYGGFDIFNSEYGYNVTNGMTFFSAHTYSVGFPTSSHIYSSVSIRDNCSQIFFSSNCWASSQLWYCDNCSQCHDCFACVGLKHKRFCIFNVQYTESEYRKLFSVWREAMLERGEWGLFFPIEHSPFCYDDSAAQDFFPLTREELKNKGWKISPDQETPIPVTKNSDDKFCEICDRPYRVIDAELKLYKKFNIPPASECPDCRLTRKLKTRSPYQLDEKICQLCENPVLTNISSSSAKVIWCEPCFIKEVF